ncbi:MAG: hypothetical protein ACO24P_00270 [Candidatus Nanopelagicaceae bacterium]
MAAPVVKLKRSSIPGKIPLVTDLGLGELALNTYDGKAFFKKNVGGTESIVEIGGGGGALTVGTYGTTAADVGTSVTALRFDSDAGFSVVAGPNGNAEARISLGSTFKTWHVAGQSDLIAEGEDEITIEAGDGIVLYTSDSGGVKRLTIASYVEDGDKGDITVSGSGTSWIIDNGAVTYSKIQNISTTDRLLGRTSEGSGPVEEVICTAAGRALLDDIDAAAQRTTLGLGTLATQSGTFSGTHSGTSSGTNTGDQTIELIGDVTGSGSGQFSTVISDDAVTFAKLQNIEANTLIGRSTGGTGNAEAISVGSGLSLTGGILSTSSSGGASDLDGLSDVIITSPSESEVLIYNGTTWVNGTISTGPAGSIEPPYILNLYNKNNSGTTASFDGVETRFQLRNIAGSNVSLSTALGITVSVDGVIQKPNTGSPTPPFDGFYLIENATSGTDIVFSEAPPAGSDFFGVSSALFSGTVGESPVKVLDDISGSFNGTQTNFTLQELGQNYLPSFNDSLLIFLGGVVQIKDASYSMDGSVITFSEAPVAGTTFLALDFKTVIGSGGGGGGSSSGDGIITTAIFQNKNTVNTNIVLETSYNGLSAGPITIAENYAVTVPENSTWVIV